MQGRRRLGGVLTTRVAFVIEQALGHVAYGMNLRRALEAHDDLECVFLDVPLEEGLARVRRRGGRDRLEAEVREFHERVRGGYLELIAAEPGRWVALDGRGTPDEVACRVHAAVTARGIVEEGERGLR